MVCKKCVNLKLNHPHLPNRLTEMWCNHWRQSPNHMVLVSWHFPTGICTETWIAFWMIQQGMEIFNDFRGMPCLIMLLSPSRQKESSRWWRCRCWLVRMVTQPFWTSPLAPLRKSWYASLSQPHCTSVIFWLWFSEFRIVCPVGCIIVHHFATVSYRIILYTLLVHIGSSGSNAQIGTMVMACRASRAWMRPPRAPWWCLCPRQLRRSWKVASHAAPWLDWQREIERKTAINGWQPSSGWWFGFFLFFHMLGIIIPTDQYFQRVWNH